MSKPLVWTFPGLLWPQTKQMGGLDFCQTGLLCRESQTWVLLGVGRKRRTVLWIKDQAIKASFQGGEMLLGAFPITI